MDFPKAYCVIELSNKQQNRTITFCMHTRGARVYLEMRFDVLSSFPNMLAAPLVCTRDLSVKSGFLQK